MKKQVSLPAILWKPMPKTLFLLLAVAVCMLFGVPYASSQTFETTVGSPTSDEGAWDGQWLKSGKYVTVSSTTSFSPKSRILFNRFKDSGQREISLQLYSNTGPYATAAFEPRAIEHNNATTPGDIYLSIAGMLKEPTANSKAFVLRALGAGNPIFAQALTPVSGGGYSERAMAVERLSAGGIVVVGNSDKPSGSSLKSQFFATRFTASLGTSASTWSFRYNLPVLSTNQYAVRESCTGNVTDAGVQKEVIAVTGRTYPLATPGNYHTFVTCIDAATGTERWTRIINSGLAADEGMDLVQNPFTHNFYVVGYVFSGTFKYMWICELDQNGALVSSAYYVLLDGNDLGMVARDVCLSVTPNWFVATGYREVRNADGSKQLKTFVMEIATGTTPVFKPTWARWYDRSNPSPNYDESIHLVPFVAITSSYGYFVTTNAQLPSASGTYDLHALRVDGIGQAFTWCPINDFKVFPVVVGSATSPLPFVPAASVWSSFAMTSSDAALEADQCQPPIVIQGVEDRDAGAPSERAGTVTLYPNPSEAGGAALIRFDLPEAQAVHFSVWNMVGRQVQTLTRQLSEGEQTLELSAATLPPGTYLVRIDGAFGTQTLKWLVEAR